MIHAVREDQTIKHTFHFIFLFSLQWEDMLYLWKDGRHFLFTNLPLLNQDDLTCLLDYNKFWFINHVQLFSVDESLEFVHELISIKTQWEPSLEEGMKEATYSRMINAKIASLWKRSCSLFLPFHFVPTINVFRQTVLISFSSFWHRCCPRWAGTGSHYRCCDSTHFAFHNVCSICTVGTQGSKYPCSKTFISPFNHPRFLSHSTQGYEYSRSLNPTRKAFETAVATLEQAKYGAIQLI